MTKRAKGEAHALVLAELAKVDLATPSEIAKAVGLEIGYATLLLRDLMARGKAERVKHGIYRIAETQAAVPPPSASPLGRIRLPGGNVNLERVRQELSAWLAQYSGPPDSPQALHVAPAHMQLEMALGTPRDRLTVGERWRGTVTKLCTPEARAWDAARTGGKQE